MPTPADQALPPPDLPDWLPFDDMLRSVFDVSLTGLVFYLPVYDPAGSGEVVDFTFEYLNPAAQRMLYLPARPAHTHLAQFPSSAENGGFAFHQDAFLSGEPAYYELLYQSGGLDNFFRCAGRRVGKGLLISFTDTADQPRTAAEQALREAQAKQQATHLSAEGQRQLLHGLLDQAPVAIAFLEGPAYTITMANPAVCAIWGRSQAQVVGLPLLQALPELEGQGFDQLLADVVRTGKSFVGTEVPVQLRRQNKLDIVYFNFVYQLQRNGQGQPAGVLVVASDVTELVLARQRVEQQERHTNELNEELAAANEELAAANEEMQAANEQLNASYDELTHTQQDLLSLNQELEARVQQRTFDLQRAQRREARQRGRLERLFMQAPAAICILDGPTFVYELVNPGYQQLFPGRALQGKPLLEALPELTDQPVWHSLRQVYETGETHQEEGILIPVAREEGGPLESFYFNYIQQARYNEQGQIDGVVVFAYDVTEQVLARQQIQNLNLSLANLNQALLTANNELSDANTQLTRTNVDLDNFIYSASHDLKAPISNIEGLLYALREELSVPEPAAGPIEGILERMLDSVERFKRTIDHLTEVTKLQKEYAAASTAVDLAAIIEGVRLDLAPLLREAGAKVLVDVAGCPPILFPEKNLRSVVYNLLSNALKYRSPDRTCHIALSAHQVPGYTVFEVHDNGLGIADDQQPKLYTMFQRFHDHVEGTGIGLYMVKKMVENAGGRIDVHSQLGTGTTFFVYFKQSPDVG